MSGTATGADGGGGGGDGGGDGGTGVALTGCGAPVTGTAGAGAGVAAVGASRVTAGAGTIPIRSAGAFAIDAAETWELRVAAGSGGTAVGVDRARRTRWAGAARDGSAARLAVLGNPMIPALGVLNG